MNPTATASPEDDRTARRGVAADDVAAYSRQVAQTLTPWSQQVETWERSGSLPPQVFADLGAAGLFRTRWAHGRTGGVPLALALARECAKVNAGLALGVTLHSETFLSTLSRLARTERQREILAQSLRGDQIGCFALTEPGGGSDIAGITTRADRDGGGWTISGTKCFISNADTATQGVVVAQTDLDGRGGLSLFLVPLTEPVARVSGIIETSGVRSCATTIITLDGALPGDALLGRAGAGMTYVHQALQLERLMIAAQLVEVAGRALRLALEYARSRVTFEKRLLDHSVLSHRLADCRTELWAAESFLRQTAERVAAGLAVSHEVAALKLFCSTTAGTIVDECMQALGGRGYSAPYQLERCWRDFRVARWGAGSDEMMRELVAGTFRRPDPEAAEWCRRAEQELFAPLAPAPPGAENADGQWGAA
jgi:alkylation response protein AidB-like acyl-CoA dehydrogenase